MPPPRPSDQSRRRVFAQDGQAAVSFVAVLPLLLAACVLVAQVAVVGYSAWSAASAARAGARAVLVGEPPEPAARAALPGALGGRASVAVDEPSGEVEVEVVAPRLLPLIPPVAVAGSAAMDISGGVGG